MNAAGQEPAHPDIIDVRRRSTATRSQASLQVAGALALLCATGTSSAQSQVTIWGIVDLNVGVLIGSKVKSEQTGTANRIGFKGEEDLGAGWKASFDLEHRINTDTGSNEGAFGSKSPAPFWSGQSAVGVGGPFGKVTLGRQYSAAVWSQIGVDPWFWDTVAGSFGTTAGGFANIWYNAAATYSYDQSGFSFKAQVAQKEKNAWFGGPTVKTPASLGLGYHGGARNLQFGHERMADGVAKWTTLSGGYDFGILTLRGLLGDGTNPGNQPVAGRYLSASVPFGSNTLHVSWANTKTAHVSTLEKVSLGLYHALSKRTQVYVNVANDSKVAANKTGYQAGIRHSF
ncbi:porin [Aquabacterium sp. J223]|uniref:porin n=1 Tax=Aquabacterium sp. J223 TaxID=2898431 RepID=UPI0021ADAC58|nr:porin [Aquabacterium sp. J223]UUX94052.1 porin [Aquabacterium sp. J223]